MPRITEELLRKRAEHNDKCLPTLEEITLHQQDLERIELIGSLCPKLKILFFQNNLIPKIEGLHRLKCLEYLNMALNNVRVIEGLDRCESLTKLDLTVNFIDVDTLEESILNLQENEFLKELFLTGNPCQEFPWYRVFVIAFLPQLKRLDGVNILKSEQIKAKQRKETLRGELRKAAAIRQRERATELESEEKAKADGTWEIDTAKHTPAARYETYLQEQKQKEDDEFDRKANEKFGKPEDPVKEARKRLGEKAYEKDDGTLPSQRNQHRLEFSIEEDDGEGNIRVLIKCPKFVDTDLIEVDIHPLWFQAIIKKKSILLHLPAEVYSDKSRIRRILSTGWIELICPRIHPLPKRTRPKLKSPTKPGVSSKERVTLDMTHEEFIDDPDVPPLM